MKTKLVVFMFVLVGCLTFGAQKPEKALFEAISNKKLEEVKAIAPQVKNFEEKNFWGETPLVLAIKKGDLEIVKAVVEGGANPLSVTQKQETMFFVAVKENKTEIAKYFVEKGVDVKKDDKSGEFPLQIAIEKRNVELVKFIIEKGETPERETKNGESLITRAIKMRNVEMVTVLLELKADANKILDKKNNTPLHVAADNRSGAILEILVKYGANLNAKNSEGVTPIELAAKKDEECAIVLLNSGAEFNDNVYEGVISNNFANAFKIMVEKEKRDLNKIEIYAKNMGDVISHSLSSNNGNEMNTNYSILTYVIKRDSDKILGVLIDKNQPLDYHGIYKSSLDANKIGIIKLILDKGKMNVNDKMVEGGNRYSQLFYLVNKPRREEIRRDENGILYSEAGYKNRLPIVEELIKRGADKKEMINGKGLAEIADSRELSEMAAILRK